MKTLILCIAVLALGGVAAASGYTTGSAFRHENNAIRCGTPISAITWTTKSRAIQRFQHCSLVATYATTTPVASATRTLPAPTPTSVPSRTPTSVAPTPTAVPTGTPVPSADPVQYELSLLNSTRAQYGRAPLTLNVTQSGSSSASCRGSWGHSYDMAASGFIWHTNPSYPASSFPNDICVPAWMYGENVGMAGFGSWQTDLSYVHQLMMGEGVSTCAQGTISHACNIINANYTQVGIGIVQSGGATWLTTDFTA